MYVVCESCGQTVCTVPGCEASEQALGRIMANSRERWNSTDWEAVRANTAAAAAAKAKKYGMTI